MPDAADSYAHNSQAGFYVTIHGSEQDLVMYCGDRWGDFAGNVKDGKQYNLSVRDLCSQARKAGIDYEP